MYLFYTRNTPNKTDVTVATFTDDILVALLVINSDIVKSINKIQIDTNQLLEIKLNKAKSSHINFSNRQLQELVSWNELSC